MQAPRATRQYASQRGVTLVIALLMLVILTLAGLSVARLSSVALHASGDLAEQQMLAASNDQALMAVKQALAAVPGSVAVSAAGQPWYNTGSAVPDAEFWQACQPAGGTADSCASTTVTVGGQQVTVQYIVRATPYSQQLGTVTSQGQQLTGSYYQVFTHASVPDGTVADTEAWYLKQ